MNHETKNGLSGLLIVGLPLLLVYFWSWLSIGSWSMVALSALIVALAIAFVTGYVKRWSLATSFWVTVGISSLVGVVYQMSAMTDVSILYTFGIMPVASGLIAVGLYSGLRALRWL